MNLSRRNKRILTWLGYPLLALTTFVMTLHWTFPYDRVKQKMVDELSDKYEVSIKSVEPTLLPGGMVINGLMLRPRPKKPGEEPPTISIKEVELDASILAAVRGTLDLDIDAQIGSGSVSGNLVVSKAGLWADFSTRRLPLGDVPGLGDAVGLPMSGGLNATLSLHLPKKRWREANGTIKLSCPGCTAGDGVAKIKPKPREGRKLSPRLEAQMSFIGDGVAVPMLDLGNLSGVIEIKGGKGVIKNFGGESADGEMIIEGDLDFKDPFKNTLFPGCFKFKFSEDLKKREPKFSNIPTLMGAAVLPDGFANMRITGTLGQLRWKAKLKCKITDPDPMGGAGDARPPSISVTRPDPDESEEPPRELDGPAASGPQVGEESKEPPAEPEGAPGDNGQPPADVPPDGTRLRRTDDVQPGEPPGEGEGDPQPGEGEPPPEGDEDGDQRGDPDPSGAPSEEPEPETYP
jgi:type II secretion system protein N